MPSYYDAVATEDQRNMDDKPKSSYEKLILVFAYLFFAFSCGIEGFFQSQTYTFGICGPLSLTTEKVGQQYLVLRTRVTILQRPTISGCHVDNCLLRLLSRRKVSIEKCPR